MLKPIAITLLLVLSGDMTIPVLFANTESTMPSCCRRDGKHHCMAQTSGPDASSVTLVRARCPDFPTGAVIAVHGKHAATPPARMVYAAVFSHPTAKAQTEARYRSSHSRTKQKRGPPSLI